MQLTHSQREKCGRPPDRLFCRRNWSWAPGEWPSLYGRKNNKRLLTKNVSLSALSPLLFFGCSTGLHQDIQSFSYRFSSWSALGSTSSSRPWAFSTDVIFLWVTRRSFPVRHTHGSVKNKCFRLDETEIEKDRKTERQIDKETQRETEKEKDRGTKSHGVHRETPMFLSKQAFLIIESRLQFLPFSRQKIIAQGPDFTMTFITWATYLCVH